MVIEVTQQYEDLVGEYARAAFGKGLIGVTAETVAEAKRIVSNVYEHYGLDEHQVLNDEDISLVRSGLELD